MKIALSSLLRRLTTLALCTLVGAAQSAVLEPGRLKVGMEISYPPFESWEGDKVVGFDPELSAALGRQLGLTPAFVDTKFTGLILGLGAGHFDAVISGMYVTPERQAQADAIPYAQTGAKILVKKDSPAQPRTEHELCGLTVGLQQGTVWVGALKKLSGEFCLTQGKKAIEVREFPSAPEVSQALLSGNVQAQLEIAGAAKMFAERTRGRLVVSSPDLVYPQTLGIYVKRGNTALQADLRRALATLRASGEYQALLKKYELTAVAAD
jgi:polar amino acid transport system substrate-binding protein